VVNLIYYTATKILTLYETLLDATSVSCMNAFGRLNKAGTEKPKEKYRFLLQLWMDVGN
jgi:hypothetical protein